MSDFVGIMNSVLDVQLGYIGATMVTPGMLLSWLLVVGIIVSMWHRMSSGGGFMSIVSAGVSEIVPIDVTREFGVITGPIDVTSEDFLG